MGELLLGRALLLGEIQYISVIDCQISFKINSVEAIDENDKIRIKILTLSSKQEKD